MKNRCAVVVLTSLAIIQPAFGQQRSTGLLFLDDTAYQSIPLATTPLMGDIPPAADLSDSFPSPGDQGQQGSCVGWAVAYALKSYQEKMERKWNLDQNDRLFSPSFIYNQIKKSSGCDGGSLISDALNLVRRDGIASLSTFDYTDRACSAVPDAGVRQTARQYAIADWRRVNVQDEMEIKTQVAAGFPVVIGMMVDQAFSQLQPGQVYSTPDNVSPGGHAMVVVGYDDGKSAYKVINSWGSGWGDGGFGWVDYQTFRGLVREGYVVQDIVANPVPPTPAPTPQPSQPPSPSAPQVSLDLPSIVHNVAVPANNPFGSAPGMQIITPGNVTGASGRTIQVVAHFTYFNGPPLFANPQEVVFRDISGLVAVGSPAAQVGSDSEDLSLLSLQIPYYALNFPPTNGMNTYNLAVSVEVYLDGATVRQSQPVHFVLRW
jgi:hypothetical protein